MVIDVMNELFRNKVFLAAFLGWLSAQAIKTCIWIVIYLQHKKSMNHETDEGSFIRSGVNNLFWKAGGMPSSHTAMSSALTVAVALEEGINSNLFIVSFFYTTIVIRDSMGVRLLTGKLARRVNLLVKFHNNKHPDSQLESLEIVEGHTFSEVFVGIVLGIFISISIFLF